MDVAKKILNVFLENGGESYIVGGFVRDYLLGISSIDIDICTSLLPNKVLSIFDGECNPKMGNVKFTYEGYNVDVTTFRTEGDYFNRKPLKVEFVDSLKLDLSRRDFTINSILMDVDGNIVDPLNGKEDLDKRLIRMVGDVSTKMSEDPLRMLRAIRFSVVYDFEIEESILEFIRESKELIGNLSYERRKEELSKILESYYALRGLKYLKELDLLEILEVDFKETIVKVDNLLGMWSQLSYSENYPFTKEEKSKMQKIKAILEEGVINKSTLYLYGLDISMIAGSILGVDARKIENIWESMSIHKEDDLNISLEEIKNLLNTNDYKKIRLVKIDLINRILNGELLNRKEELIKSIIARK